MKGVFFVKTVHKVGNHSAFPELQESQDTPTQGFKKGLKYDRRKTLQISTWKKPTTICPYKSPLKKIQLWLSRTLTKETNPPHTHTLVHLSTGFKSAITRLMRAHKDAGAPMRRDSVRDSLLSHHGLNTQHCTEKNNWWATALTAHTPNLCSVSLWAPCWKELKTLRLQWSQLALGLL